MAQQIMLVDLSQTLVADGQTDDSAAINKAIDTIRQAHFMMSQYGFACMLRFPSAFIAVKSTVDLTRLQGINTVIDGNGAVIIGRCPGVPIIDALASRWLTIRDLMILGDQQSVPSIGLQIGMATTANADDHMLDNVKICGWFSQTCLYNRAAETSSFYHMFLWNSQPNSYCLIQDGLNHFNITSQFVQCNLPVDSDLSFNENEFINCDIRHSASGINMWIGDTSRHQFTRCYAETDGDTSVVLFNGSNGHRLLNMDCHFETVNLKNIFRISALAKTVQIRGFTFIEHQCFASKSVFVCDSNITYVGLENFSGTITSFNSATCKVFDNPALWGVSGSYTTSWGSNWNATNFRGVISNGLSMKMIGVAVAIPSGATGNRPILNSLDIGTQYFDTQLHKVVVWSGTAWLTSDGKSA